MSGSVDLVRPQLVPMMLARADVAHELGTRFTSCLEMGVLDVHREEETAIQTASLEQQHLVSAETLDHLTRCYEVIILLTRNFVEESKELWYMPAVKNFVPPRGVVIDSVTI